MRTKLVVGYLKIQMGFEDESDKLCAPAVKRVVLKTSSNDATEHFTTRHDRLCNRRSFYHDGST
eukprot:UN09840